VDALIRSGQFPDKVSETAGNLDWGGDSCLSLDPKLRPRIVDVVEIIEEARRELGDEETQSESPEYYRNSGSLAE